VSVCIDNSTIGERCRHGPQQEEGLIVGGLSCTRHRLTG
jgi:hypothetical protein